MKIKEPINADGTIDIFGDDGRIAVTVHPTELTEKGMADAVAMAERIAAMPEGDMPDTMFGMVNIKSALPSNYHLLELQRAAWQKLQEIGMIQIDGNSIPKKTVNAEAVTIGFTKDEPMPDGKIKKIKYTSVLIAWPEVEVDCLPTMVEEGREHDREAEFGTRQMNVEAE